MNNCNEIKITGSECCLKPEIRSAEESEALISACLSNIINLRKEIQDLIIENNRLHSEIKEPRCNQCCSILGDNWCADCAGAANIEKVKILNKEIKFLKTCLNEPRGFNNIT